MKTATIKTKSGEVMEVAPPRSVNPSEIIQSEFCTPADDEKIFKQNPNKLVKFKISKPARIYSHAKKTSDYLDFDKAMTKGRELLWSKKDSIFGFYVILSINTGLRVSDVTSLRHSDLANLKPGDLLILTEHKTKKTRKIQINTNIQESYQYLQRKLQEARNYKSEGFIFTSQKGGAYCTVSLNRILKQTFAGYAKNVSTHSLRKTFGRRVYDNNKQSEHALMTLSAIFNHTSMAVTRVYLGLRQEEFNDIYMNL